MTRPEVGTFVPSDDQWRGVTQALEHRLSILTGGPGTGKSATMRALVELVKARTGTARLCAPTGKAARRLSELTGADATTIHRLLEWIPGEGFGRGPDDPIEGCDVLIVDEASMLSVYLAEALLGAVGPRTHVVLVGDVDQLAPVGPGRVLEDLIDAGVVPAVRLTEIFRQAARSMIVRAAHAINEGELPMAVPRPDDVRDFFVIERDGARAIFDEVCELAATRLPAHYDLDPAADVQVLAPMHKGPVGIDALNSELRARLNPDGAPIEGTPLRVGDKVMQTRNSYEHDLFNGERGVLRAPRRRVRQGPLRGRGRPAADAARRRARHAAPRVRSERPQGAGLAGAGDRRTALLRAPHHAHAQPRLHRGDARPGRLRRRRRDGSARGSRPAHRRAAPPHAAARARVRLIGTDDLEPAAGTYQRAVLGPLAQEDLCRRIVNTGRRRDAHVTTHLRETLAAAVAIFLIAAPAAGARKPGLALTGGTAQTVRYVAGEGRAILAVRNVSGRAGRLELAFVSVDGRRFGVSRTQRGGRLARVAVADPRDLARPLAAGANRQVELRLRLPRHAAPADGSGRLAARLSRAREAVSLQVRGAPPDIAFDPSKLTIDVSQACWMFGRGTCGNTQTVLLRGRDAALWASRTRAPDATVSLNNEHGGSVTVRLRDLRRRDGSVQATIDTSDFSEAGRYAGRLPLEPNGLAGPGLGVEVKVRWSLASAVATIFAGALFGGFFLRRFEIRRRRRLLEMELLSALGRYDKQRALWPGAPASYDLDPMLKPRHKDKAEVMPYPGRQGVSALLWHIRSARDDADFTEDSDRAHDLIGAIDRWLALEPVAREAAQLLAAAERPRRSGAALSDTTAYQDLAYLRMRATTPPADDRACKHLMGALATQGRVASKSKVMWSALAELESRDGMLLDQARSLAELDVRAIEARFPAFADRDPEQTDQLLVAMAQAEERLHRIFGEANGMASCPGVADARGAEERLGASARHPEIERAQLDIGPWELRLAGMFSALAFRSVVWTLARALVAAVAYALAIYSDTWGSVTDFASAFTAGFLTETLVNWASLPAFASQRNRADDGAPATVAEAPSGDAAQPPTPITHDLPASRSWRSA